MRKIFAILCVMAFSTTFGVDLYCEENPTDEECMAALHELREQVDLDEDDLETLGELIDGFDPTLTRPREEPFPTFDERLEAVHEFVHEISSAEPGDIIPMPYSLEVFHVKSQEETMHEMLNHPNDCIDTIMGSIIQKQISCEEQVLEDFMPASVLDPSGMSGIKNLSERQLHNMYFCELSKDYSKLTLEDLGRSQSEAYNQMFMFLRNAEKNAKRTYETNIRNAIAIIFADGIADLCAKPNPRFQFMKNLAKGIMYLAGSSHTDLSDMYHNLEMAIKWAKAGDDYGTAAAQRMGRK